MTDPAYLCSKERFVDANHRFPYVGCFVVKRRQLAEYCVGCATKSHLEQTYEASVVVPFHPSLPLLEIVAAILNLAATILRGF